MPPIPLSYIVRWVRSHYQRSYMQVLVVSSENQYFSVFCIKHALPYHYKLLVGTVNVVFIGVNLKPKVSIFKVRILMLLVFKFANFMSPHSASFFVNHFLLVTLLNFRLTFFFRFFSDFLDASIIIL